MYRKFCIMFISTFYTFSIHFRWQKKNTRNYTKYCNYRRKEIKIPFQSAFGFRYYCLLPINKIIFYIYYIEIPFSLSLSTLYPWEKVVWSIYKLLRDKVKCKNIRLTLECALITTMTTDFYSIYVCCPINYSYLYRVLLINSI